VLGPRRTLQASFAQKRKVGIQGMRRKLSFLELRRQRREAAGGGNATRENRKDFYQQVHMS